MNEQSMDKLISTAGKRLNIAPDELKKMLESGDVKALSAGLSKADKEKLRAVLANKELMERLKKASTPEEAVKLLRK